MRLSELLRRVTPELPDFDPEITFITDDSRKVKPGCAFVCIRGNHIDGHTLAAKAVESGAAAVIAQADTFSRSGATASFDWHNRNKRQNNLGLPD